MFQPEIIETLVESLEPHLLRYEERWALGHPVATKTGVQLYCSAPERTSQPTRELDAIAHEFIPGCGVHTSLRQCARCDVRFLPGRDTGCLYHWGRVMGSRYTCCHSNRGAPGCREGRHAWSGVTLGVNGPFQDFVSTATLAGGVYAIDGEMVYTEQGLELARVALTDMNGVTVYDTLMQPSAPIVDYNTAYSGITENMLNTTDKTLRKVQQEIFGFVGVQTILVGHALGSDLRALKMVHERVVDTSALFPHSKGLPWRQSLRGLCAKHLKYEIQCSSAGHSPAEDARAAIDLVLWKVFGWR